MGEPGVHRAHRSTLVAVTGRKRDLCTVSPPPADTAERRSCVLLFVPPSYPFVLQAPQSRRIYAIQPPAGYVMAAPDEAAPDGFGEVSGVQAIGEWR